MRIINGVDDLEQNPYSVGNCARCGGDHASLKVVRLNSSVLEDNIWYHWYAICPVTSEGILIALVEPDGTTKDREELGF